MNPQVANLQTVSDRIASLEKKLSSRQFLEKEGIGNEVPFFIFAYEANLEDAVVQETRHLVARLENSGIGLLEINLYDLVVELIRQRGKWDRLLEQEASMPKDKFKTQLQNLTDVESKITPAMAARIACHPRLQLLLLTGVGLVYPYIRTHNVLNNLQKEAKDYPTLLFFPGYYTYTEGRGQSLDLFGELNEDGYYRAFDIDSYKLRS
jgi:hypothetical protein